MKRFLIYLCVVIYLTASCKKAPNNVKENPVPLGKSFVPVLIFGSPGPWGGSMCSTGFMMHRQDSNVLYNAPVLPGNITIPSIPTLVGILFHDTTQVSSCWHSIVVDSIRF